MRRSTALLFLLAASGCCSPPSPEVEAIPIEDAMASVGAGIVTLRRELAGTPTGLVASEVVVVLDAGLIRKESGSFGLAVTVPTVPVGVEAGYSASVESSRRNTITIKLQSVLALAAARPAAEQEAIYGLAKREDLLIGAVAALVPVVSRDPALAPALRTLTQFSDEELLAIIEAPTEAQAADLFRATASRFQ